MYTHIYIRHRRTYLHIRTHTRIYTNIHAYIHTYTQTYTDTHHQCTHSHTISIHRCTRAYDYVQMHALVKLQLIFFWRMHTNAHVSNHIHTNTHVHVDTYMQTHVCMLSLSPICMRSLVMSQLRMCLQVTINPLPPGHQTT